MKRPDEAKLFEIEDGLETLRKVMTLRDIMSLIERTALWVAPETFHLLPVWYPEHARRGLFYKKGWLEPQMNTSRATGNAIHKGECNVHANKAITQALGLTKKLRTNWTCCHIWGLDDPTFQRSNLIAMDRRFFSCIANMVLLPTPLKAFTDVMPEVKALLRICAHNLYGWRCDHESLFTTNSALDAWTDWDAYPESWPRTLHEKLPLGVVPLTARIRSRAKKRLASISHDLSSAGPNYPRDEVKDVLTYWKIAL